MASKRKNEGSSQERKNKKQANRASFSPSKPSTSTAGLDMEVNDDSFFHDEDISQSFKSVTVSDSKVITITPGRKRSFKRISVAVDPTQLPMNDDGTELIEDADSQDADEQAGKDPSAQGPNDRAITVTHSMTVDQMKEHVHRCLELNTENKINSKNVFALKLIDCMTILSKSEDENNFAAMACQLDAGAKIYSLRVDAVHQQVMKLVESCIFAEKKANAQRADGEEGSDESDDDGQPGTSDDKVKEKKRKRKKVLASRDQITRNLKENDPKNKYFNCEALPGGIFDQVRLDPKDLSLSLAKDTQFWIDLANYKPMKAEEPTCEVDKIVVLDKSIGPDLEETINSSMFAATEPPSFNENVSEEPLGPVDIDRPIRDSDDDDDEIVDEPPISITPEDGAEPEEKLPEVELVSRAMSRMTKAGNKEVSRLDALKALFHKSGENDYHYLKKCNAKYWAGPKRGVIRMANKKKPAARKKKEPSEIVYDTEEAKRKSFDPKKKTSSFTAKRRTHLSEKMLKKWKMSDITLPDDIHFERRVLFTLFHIELENVSVFQQNDDPPEGAEIGQVVEGEFDTVDDPIEEEEEGPLVPGVQPLSSDSDEDFLGFPAAAEDEGPQPLRIPDSDSGSDFLGFGAMSLEDESQTAGENAAKGAEDDGKNGAQNRDAEDCDMEGVAGPSVEVKQEPCETYEGENLVPMVKVVNVEPIKYTVKPHRIDMGHLKQVLFSIIVRMLEDRENEMKAGGELGDRPYVQFRDVLSELFNTDDLHHRTREDLSVPIAFLALLFLANEHNLCLEPEQGGAEVLQSPNQDPRISFMPGEMRPPLPWAFQPEPEDTDSD